MQKLFLIAGSLFGGLGVVIGAFGAHALKAFLEQSGKTDTFETAVRYQFYHCLALVAVGLLLHQYNSQEKLLNLSGYCFISGIVIFSGSLYILCLSGINRWGAVTPFGGLLLIIGWCLLLAAAIRIQS